MARTYISAASHAVIGGDAQGGRGVLFWHDNELDAHREARSIRAEGGTCRVVSAPGGELQGDERAQVRSLVFSGTTA